MRRPQNPQDGGPPWQRDSPARRVLEVALAGSRQRVRVRAGDPSMVAQDVEPFAESVHRATALFTTWNASRSPNRSRSVRAIQALGVGQPPVTRAAGRTHARLFIERLGPAQHGSMPGRRVSDGVVNRLRDGALAQ